MYKELSYLMQSFEIYANFEEILTTQFYLYTLNASDSKYYETVSKR